MANIPTHPNGRHTDVFHVLLDAYLGSSVFQLQPAVNSQSNGPLAYVTNHTGGFGELCLLLLHLPPCLTEISSSRSLCLLTSVFLFQLPYAGRTSTASEVSSMHGYEISNNKRKKEIKINRTHFGLAGLSRLYF